MAATIRSETYDAVLTTTMRHMMDAGVHDNISRSNTIVRWLERRGRFRRVSGGERIKVALMYALNSGADIYSGYGQLNDTPQDGITSAFWDWSQLSVPITISGKEKLQNSGREGVISLLRAKMDQSEATAQQLSNNCIVAGRIQSGATGSLNAFVPRIGKVDTSANGPDPLPFLVDASPSRSVAVGNINGATETWWRNNATASSASTFIAYKREKTRLYNQCRKGPGGAPDLIISTEAVHELYSTLLSSQERYAPGNTGSGIDVLGGMGEDRDEWLKFKGAYQIWDEDVPDPGTTTANPVDGIGTADDPTGAHGAEYYLNTRAMEFVVHTQRNWIMTPFMTPVNQDASVAHLLWMGGLVVNNRRKLGVLYDVDNTIAA